MYPSPYMLLCQSNNVEREQCGEPTSTSPNLALRRGGCMLCAGGAPALHRGWNGPCPPPGARVWLPGPDKVFHIHQLLQICHYQPATFDSISLSSSHKRLSPPSLICSLSRQFNNPNALTFCQRTTHYSYFTSATLFSFNTPDCDLPWPQHPNYSSKYMSQRFLTVIYAFSVSMFLSDKLVPWTLLQYA